MKNRPPTPLCPPPPGTQARGTALLIVLAILTILSVLVLGFVTSMITESTSSNSVEMGYRTKMVAHGALSHAIELLRSNIPDPTPITKSPSNAPRLNWATNPGRLTLITNSGNRSHIPLHSGVAPNPEEDVIFDARSTDLNRPLAGRSRAPIAGGNEDTPRPEMRIAWIPVLADPSQKAGPENRMTARYAFWIDDETSKLNTSVALGKTNPDEIDIDDFDNWKDQLERGWVTPVFAIKNDKTEDDSSSAITSLRVSLGHPWSVNFDTLFEDDDMPIDLIRLFQESHVHGFQRYPDAILRFIDLPNKEKRKWYDENLWNITFYNRSPEFNAFGFSRLFTLSKPTPLTTGPAYQTPFTEGGNAHLQALYGFPANGSSLPLDTNTDPAVRAEDRANELEQMTELTLASGKFLYQYLNQTWPGQNQSFASAYGSDEAKQMVLNMLMLSRFATGAVQGTSGYGSLINSMNYGGKAEVDTGTPERFYWRLNDQFEVDSTQAPMLPQSPGPHLNEIKFIVEPLELVVAGKRVFHLRYHYEAEYYMHPESPFASGEDDETNKEGNDINQNPNSFTFGLPFPVRVDYLKLETDDHDQTFDQADWDSENLTKLTSMPLPPGKQNAETTRYQVVRSQSFLLTDDESKIGKGAPIVFDPLKKSQVKFKVNIRLGLGSNNGAHVKQMIPLGTEPEDSLEAEISIDLSFPDPEYFVSWEVEDPRVSWHKEDWEMREDEDSMGRVNSIQPQNAESDEYNSFKYVRLLKLVNSGTNDDNGGAEQDDNIRRLSFYGDEFQPTTRFPSAGYLSMLHTGIRSRKPWRTLSLESKTSGFSDWVLMDLIGATFPLRRGTGTPSRSLPDHWMGLSYMNATAGKVNLNNKIYPDNEWFQAPERKKPLKAVFRYLREDEEIDSLIDNILNWQSSGRAFEYVGQLSEVSGYAKGSTTWEKETLLRNMANCLTTQSNTFGVWGVAQTVVKSRESILHDEFEATDAVVGEKRFYALVERYVWPGRDGVPGNAHLSSDGEWDRLADPPFVSPNTASLPDTGKPSNNTTQPGDLPRFNVNGKFALIDGPNSVDMAHNELLANVPYESTALAKADNPADAVMKYRVIYFKYLDH